MRRRTAALVLVLTTLAACGGDPAVYERGPQTAAARSISLPEPVPASPAYVVSSRRGLRVDRLEKTPGVAVVAEVSVGRVRVRGPSGTRVLRVGAVDALEYRSVAPAATRSADFVWASMLAGNAVITFAAAERLGIGTGGTIRLPGYGPIAVGAFADNASPRNVADILVDLSVGQAVGLSEPRLAVVGARSGVTIEALGRDLRRRAPAARIRRLIPDSDPAAPVPEPQPVATASGALIGSMTYRILRNGFIEPDPAWVSSNIASGSVPILGTVTCHRILFPQLGAALAEIEQRGLAGSIRPGDYGGCYVPRFIDRDPSKPLSMHAFGLAVDINVSSNRLGTAGDMDPRVIAILERWGFFWGGRWGRPDPMHFELARLVHP